MICPHNPETEAYSLWVDTLCSDLEKELENELLYINALALIDAGMWLPKEGLPIPIAKMSGSHIRNSIAMLDRNFPNYDDLTAEIAAAWRAALKKELEKRYPPIDPAFMYE